MGCTNARLKDPHEYGYMQKETLYYKLKDKRAINASNEGLVDSAQHMVNESLSSNDSQSDDSSAGGGESDENEDGGSKRDSKITKVSILYLHKPSRPSKLKEMMHSGSRFDYSDIKSQDRSDLRSEKENILDRSI